MVADAEPEVAQPLGFAEIVISRPAGPIKILFERLDQRIKAWIQNRTVVEIDDPVAAPLVVAETQRSIRRAFERDQGAIAVTECPLVVEPG